MGSISDQRENSSMRYCRECRRCIEDCNAVELQDGVVCDDCDRSHYIRFAASHNHGFRRGFDFSTEDEEVDTRGLFTDEDVYF